MLDVFKQAQLREKQAVLEQRVASQSKHRS
jgi:hypothetical protein